MKKNILKKTVILSVSLFVTEIINMFAYNIFDPISSDIKRIRFYVMFALLSLIMYYIIGIKIFAKFSSEEKKYSAIIVSVLTIISYPASFLASITGEYYRTHIVSCSPISYIIGKILYSISNDFDWTIVAAIILSPISVGLVWFFSKHQNSLLSKITKKCKIYFEQKFALSVNNTKINILKKTVILSLLLSASEIINAIVCFFAQEWSAYFKNRFNLSDDVYSIRDNVSYAVMAIVSLILYYVIGRKIFAKFSSEEKKYSAIIVSILMVLSYPASELLTEIFGVYFIGHMMICSPLAYVISMFFSEIEINYFLSIIILGLLSPISVLLIWLFSKIGRCKKEE